MTPIAPPRGMSRRDFVRAGVSAAASPLILACGSPTDSNQNGPRLTARPGTPSVTPDLGLSDLDIDGGPSGLLYVPQGYSGDAAIPLFIGLHGAGGDADNWQSYPGRAEDRGMAFLATDSRGATWDLIENGGFGPDVARLDRALAYTFDRVRVDSTRIALGGFSDGASYALSLGVSNGDLFTHLVGYSPGFIASSPPTVGMPRIYISHGLLDGIIPVSASRNSTVPILRDSGYDVTYEEFDGGHEVPAAISESALDWFLA